MKKSEFALEKRRTFNDVTKSAGLIFEGVHADSSKQILTNIITIFVLVEKSIELNRKKCSWINNDNLLKRRGNYDFDLNLQSMINDIKESKDVKVNVIECGNKSYYKSEILFFNEYYVHFNSSFNCNSKYNERYLKMNSNLNSAKFSYFLYHLNETKTQVVSLKYIIPHLSDSTKDTVVDLYEYFQHKRIEVFSKDKEVGELLNDIKWLE